MRDVAEDTTVAYELLSRIVDNPCCYRACLPTSEETITSETLKIAIADYSSIHPSPIYNRISSSSLSSAVINDNDSCDVVILHYTSRLEFISIKQQNKNSMSYSNRYIYTGICITETTPIILY